MLARRDGSYNLMLWRELPAWDHFARKTIPISELSATVHLPNDTSRAELLQYNRSYGLDRTQLPVSRNGDTSTFKVSDSIAILHLYR